MWQAGITTVVFLVGLILACGVAAPPGLHVAVVDTQDIVKKSGAGSKVAASIQKQAQALKNPLLEARQKLSQEVDEFLKNSGSLKEKERLRQAADLEQRMKTVRQKEAEAEIQLATYREKAMRPMLGKLQQAIGAVAKDHKIDLVLDKRKAGILFAGPALEVTDQVRVKFSN
jgi:outer membrane protein